MHLASTPPVATGQDLLFAASGDVVFSIELATGHITRANMHLEALTGLPLDELLGAPASILSPRPGTPHSEGPRKWTPFNADMIRSPGLHEEVAIARQRGVDAIVTLRVAHDGTGAALCSARDESERRMLERELITKHLALLGAHEELEARIEEMARMGAALEAKKREIGELSATVAAVSRRATLAEVAAELAHSLNNPLGALTSSLRMLGKFRGRVADADHERYGTLLDRCQDMSGRMARVVDDLRYACREETPEREAEVVDLTSRVEAALSLLSYRVPEGVFIERLLTPGIRARVPADEVHHAVINLVENALLAVNGHGRIRVECVAYGDLARLSVLDSGVGVDPAIAGKVFDPFFTTRPHGLGTGVGLSMVRRLALRHGGRVSVENRGLLGGATFHVELPLLGGRDA